MNYIDGFIDATFDTEESQNEAAAAHQMALDVLYRVGCQYNVDKQDMVMLCQLANINVNEFMNYSGAAT